MAERRVWLGTGAMVMGLGAALLSGSGVAHADGGGGDDGSGAQKATQKASSPAKSGQAANRRASAPAGDRAPAAAARPPRAAAGHRAPAPAATARTTPAPAAVAAPDRGPQTDVPETVAAESAAPDVVAEPVAGKAAVASRPVVAAARKAQNTQALGSVGSLTAAPATAAPPVALAATLLGALTGLVSPRQAAATTTVAAPQVLNGGPLLPVGPTNGVTGVQVGHSRLQMPGALIGDTVAADWYFPTQADGTVDAQGVIWLQHGFGATNTFYSALATELARQTNSIVVSPTLSFSPITFSGGCLTCASSEQAAAAMFEDPNRTALTESALAAGYTGDALPTRFVLAGHSAGGGFASAVGADYVTASTDEQDQNLAGIVMFDGVSNGALGDTFANQVNALHEAGRPIYQIAAPAQSWNFFGATTNVLAANSEGQFAGVVLQGGSHVDSMLGVNFLFDTVLQLVTKRVPAGNTAATYTLSTGWINDMYTPGAGPQQPLYGLYAAANQQIIMGPTAAVGLPAALANQLSLGDKILEGLINTVGGLFGFQIPAPVNGGFNGLQPGNPVVRVGNGVTGVRTGTSVLDIPCGPNGYSTGADWYFPTQADGTVQANGVIYLQHGFYGFKSWYADMAQQLAQETNSIVVAPNIFWYDTPLCPGCYLGGEPMFEAVATMFEGDRAALNISANAAGFQGTLPQKFILTGHSAGGNLATAVGAILSTTVEQQNLLGVVMFDGVSSPPAFTERLDKLTEAGIPVYQIAAPAQSWNAYGVATEAMYEKFKDQFYGVQIDNGSHTDVVGGDSIFARLASIASAILVRKSPPGAKDAERTFASGWINDIYNGNTVYTPPVWGQTVYGIYGPNGNGPQEWAGADVPIVMGPAGATTLPAPPPVDVAQYADGQPWYEQASVKLPFSWFLVNTKAVYTPDGNGNVTVQNSGNYFGPNGPVSSITGTAVPVNAFNTRLNVGFFFGTPKKKEPGNYTILDYGALQGDQLVGGAGYDWVIVSDPSGFSGWILTRDQSFRTDHPDQYNQLLARARQLGVWGPITPTRQYPTTTSVAAVPGPAEVPASVTV